MYGSSFWMMTEKPRATRSFAREEEMIPFPSEDVTPPVTKMNLVFDMGENGLFWFRQNYAFFSFRHSVF
jgi:hypothetical protein